MIVVDEADHIQTRSQKVLSDLLGWCQEDEARLHVLLITNQSRADFLEALLRRNRRRIGEKTLTYERYLEEEVESILFQ